MNDLTDMMERFPLPRRERVNRLSPKFRFFYLAIQVFLFATKSWFYFLRLSIFRWHFLVPITLGINLAPVPVLGLSIHEEIRVLFICDKPEVLLKTSLQEIRNKEEKKVFLENGRLYFLAIDTDNVVGESQEFHFKNGSFLWNRGEFQEPSPDTDSAYRNFQFVLQFNPEEYAKWKNHSTRLSNLIWIFKGDIPNGYRRLGNTIFLSCPRNSKEIGKLRLVFRDGRLIRNSYTRIYMENWYGDL